MCCWTNPVFFAPFTPFFDPRLGRPSTPMEVYLRLMFLKFRYQLGYETLCREVADSITWRRFCRIPLDGQVPHPTTLMKITTRCGTAAVDGCNEALLAKAAEANGCARRGCAQRLPVRPRRARGHQTIVLPRRSSCRPRVVWPRSPSGCAAVRGRRQGAVRQQVVI